MCEKKRMCKNKLNIDDVCKTTPNLHINKTNFVYARWVRLFYINRSFPVNFQVIKKEQVVYMPLNYPM